MATRKGKGSAIVIVLLAAFSSFSRSEPSSTTQPSATGRSVRFDDGLIEAMRTQKLFEYPDLLTPVKRKSWPQLGPLTSYKTDLRPNDVPTVAVPSEWKLIEKFGATDAHPHNQTFRYARGDGEVKVSVMGRDDNAVPVFNAWKMELSKGWAVNYDLEKEFAEWRKANDLQLSDLATESQAGFASTATEKQKRVAIALTGNVIGFPMSLRYESNDTIAAVGFANDPERRTSTTSVGFASIFSRGTGRHLATLTIVVEPHVDDAVLSSVVEQCIVETGAK